MRFLLLAMLLTPLLQATLLTSTNTAATARFAESMNGGLSQYIDDSEGCTGNSVASYGPDPGAIDGYSTGYRPLAGVLLGVDGSRGILTVTLQADPGFRVLLDNEGTDILNPMDRELTGAETFFFTPLEGAAGGFLRIEFDVPNLPREVRRIVVSGSAAIRAVLAEV